MASVDTVVRLLESEKCRYALYYLDGQDEPVPTEELAEEVAKMQADDGETVSDAELSRYEVKLRHGELPKADEASFVEYDRDDGVVRLTGEPKEFEAILTIAEVMERPL